MPPDPEGLAPANTTRTPPMIAAWHVGTALVGAAGRALLRLVPRKRRQHVELTVLPRRTQVDARLMSPGRVPEPSSMNVPEATRERVSTTLSRPSGTRCRKPRPPGTPRGQHRRISRPVPFMLCSIEREMTLWRRSNLNSTECGIVGEIRELDGVRQKVFSAECSR